MSKRIIKSSLYTIASIISSVSLISLGSINSVYAETVDYNVNIEPSLVVTIPSNTVELNINPVTTQFNSADLSVTVGTNNATGYTLTMSSDSTELSKTGSVDTIPTLETLAGGYPEADFTVNHWGYKLSTATNYLPFATSNELDVTNAPTNSKTSTVNFAAKADLSKPAGTYKLAIDFAAVANHVPVTWEMAYTNAGKTKTEGYYSIQDATSAMCTEVDMGETITVRDTRDGETYLIGKLADNRCWLLDNLRLDLGDSTVLANTTADNTNASATSLNYMKNGGGTTSDQYATSAVSYWTSSYSFSAPLIAIKDASDTSGTGWNPNTTATSYGNGSGKIGVYYNYCAASAGSYCYGNGTSAGTSSGNAEEDICPAGWRMPTGDDSGEYQALYDEYSSASEGQAAAFRNALSTPLSGTFIHGSAYDQGSDGRFWSSTRNGNYSMYNLSVDASDVYPQSGNNRLNGYSVRCLLQ